MKRNENFSSEQTTMDATSLEQQDRENQLIAGFYASDLIDSRMEGTLKNLENTNRDLSSKGFFPESQTPQMNTSSPILKPSMQVPVTPQVKTAPPTSQPSLKDMGVLLPGGKRCKASDIHLELNENMCKLLCGPNGDQQRRQLNYMMEGMKDSPILPENDQNHNLKTCWAIPLDSFMKRLIYLNERYETLYNTAEKMHDTILQIREKKS